MAPQVSNKAQRRRRRRTAPQERQDEEERPRDAAPQAAASCSYRAAAPLLERPREAPASMRGADENTRAHAKGSDGARGAVGMLAGSGGNDCEERAQPGRTGP
jgi:hypothetical protein